ncbi:MAG: PHP domain-containing protein [Clostridia bacterium]|nr:PHP domain-containing protein [Clostridia bacterium]
MSKYYYDLHIHSCLSPCADDDMTPNNICGMAMLQGLNIVALTDHNTCGNCETFLKVAKKHGLIGIAGMELTTSEDIHIICLFEFVEKAILFSNEVQKYRLPFPNNVKLYGQQMYMDEDDNVTGVEENFLPLATTLGLDEAVTLAKSFDAVVYPAHIDRMANGIVSILGTIPESPVFSCIEFNCAEDIEKYNKDYPKICDMAHVINSDAHNLWSINEAVNFLELDDEPYSSDKVRHELFRLLRGRKGDK